MTTDPFTDAAPAETEVLVNDIIRWDDTIATDGPCDGTWDSLAEYLAGRGWARTHRTTQEPTDAPLTDAEWREFQSIPDQGYSHRAWVDQKITERLSAARAARRDEEKR